MTSAELILAARAVADRVPLRDCLVICELADRHQQLLDQAMKMERWIHERVKQDEAKRPDYAGT